MENVGKAALWVGSFENNEIFERFTVIHYTEDGDSIPSPFKSHFEIIYYNMDIADMIYVGGATQDIKELLKECPFDEEIIPLFDEIFTNEWQEEYNCYILLFDFEYPSDVHYYQSADQKNFLRYVGMIDYEGD